MSWGHVTDVFDWLFNGGITALVVLFLRYYKQIFGLLDTLTNHTSTKADNELVTRLKAAADTFVSVYEAQSLSGETKKQKASDRLFELSRTLGSTITKVQADDLIEEAYQMTIKPLQPTEIKVGQSIKLDGVIYTLAKTDQGYSLKEES